MGGSQSQNTLNDFVSSVINVCNSTAQECSQVITSDQVVNIHGINGNVDIGNLNWKQASIVNLACMQNAITKSKVQQQISQVIKQTATAISSALSLNKADTNNVTDLTTELAQNITSTFSQTCASKTTLQQEIEVSSVNGNVTLHGIHWEQSSSTISKCVQATASSTAAFQALSQAISQKAKSVQKGLLSFLGDWAGLLVVGLVVIGIMFMGGIDKLFEPYIIMLVLFLVSAFLYVGYYWHSWPYEKLPSGYEIVSTPSQPACSPAELEYGCHVKGQDETSPWYVKTQQVKTNNKHIHSVFLWVTVTIFVMLLFSAFLKLRGKRKAKLMGAETKKINAETKLTKASSKIPKSK